VFIPLQSEEGIALLVNAGLSSREFDSVVLIEDGRARIKSDAALRALEILGGVWSGARVLRIFPSGFRDFVYDRIAQLRYRLFGRKAVCELTRRRIEKQG
jgi:predicted DCC family thiol-disulfide oxidoreductase YuxK